MTTSETALSETEAYVLDAIGTACDTNPSAEAPAADIGSYDTVAALVTLGLVDPHSSAPDGSRLLVLTDGGWSALAGLGYAPPWDADQAAAL